MLFLIWLLWSCTFFILSLLIGWITVLVFKYWTSFTYGFQILNQPHKLIYAIFGHSVQFLLYVADFYLLILLRSFAYIHDRYWCLVFFSFRLLFLLLSLSFVFVYVGVKIILTSLKQLRKVSSSSFLNRLCRIGIHSSFKSLVE